MADNKFMGEEWSRFQVLAPDLHLNIEWTRSSFMIIAEWIPVGHNKELIYTKRA